MRVLFGPFIAPFLEEYTAWMGEECELECRHFFAQGYLMGREENMGGEQKFIYLITIYIIKSGRPFFGGKEWPPRPSKKPPEGGFRFPPSGHPLETTKGQGLRPLPFGNPPRLFYFRLFAERAHFVALFRLGTCPRPRYGVRGRGLPADVRTASGCFQRGAIAMAPLWSLGVRVQGKGESKRPSPGGSWGDWGAILAIKNGPPISKMKDKFPFISSIKTPRTGNSVRGFRCVPYDWERPLSFSHLPPFQRKIHRTPRRIRSTAMPPQTPARPRSKTRTSRQERGTRTHHMPISPTIMG